MGLFNKLKNVFFEEEYEEVEEEEIVKPKKEVVKVAKKIELPEIKKTKEKEIDLEEEQEEYEEDEEEVENVEKVEKFEKFEKFERVERKETEEKIEKEENKFKFPMTFEEEDFYDDSYKKEKPIVEEKRSNPYGGMKKEVKKEEPPKYIYENERVPLYEGKEEKKDKPIFRPTPIISPIYGVLDKNYKKEEIVTKKPIVLSSASAKKVDLDTVREKAYGDLASDIKASMQEEPVEKGKKEEDKFYDLNIDSPAVGRVTMGDAEEYFNDLGLEYNVDYKDTSLEKATGRRMDKRSIINDENDDEESSLENNLFDLIESMYEQKED